MQLGCLTVPHHVKRLAAGRRAHMLHRLLRLCKHPSRRCLITDAPARSADGCLPAHICARAAVRRLNGREISLRECEGELATVREMLGSVCRAIESQGAEGVPKADDKGWAVMGPLGAVQRSIVTINRFAAAGAHVARAVREPPSPLKGRVSACMFCPVG